MSFPREEPRQNHPPHIISSSSRGASPSESSSYSGNTFNDGNNSNDASISRPNFYDLTSTSYEDDYSLGNKSNNSRSSRNCSVMDDGSNFRAGFKEPSTGMQTMPLKSARNHRPIFELNEESTTTNNERNVINLLDDGSECSSGEDEMKRKRPLENDISSCGTTKIISQKLDIDSEQKKTRNLNESRKPEAGENSISTDVAKRGSRQSSAASFNVNCKQNSFHDESLSSHKPNNPYNRSTKTTATIPQQISTSCSGHPSSQSRTSSKPYNPYMKSTKSSAVFAQKSSRSNSVTPVTDERNSILLSQSNISSGPQQKTMDGAVVTFGLLALIEELRDENTFTCTRNSLPTKNAINESSSFPHQQLQHFSQNDNWSCGFRNLQMMLCSLIPKFHDIFPNGIPSLRELQTSLELLWTEGFDPDGAKHHKFKMVGKRTWIGTVEVWSYLVFRGIDATIVQFVKTQESRAALGKFVWAYFAKLIESDGCPFGGCGNRGGRNSGDLVSSQSMKSMQYVNQLLRIVKSSLGVRTRSDLSCKCPLPPLYLQWSGHSVTVVGIRKLSEDQYNLIVFDPMKKGPFIKTKLLAQVNGEVMNAPNPLSSVELPDHILRNKDCQILLCTGQLINDVDREKCKSTISCVTALKKVNVVG